MTSNRRLQLLRIFTITFLLSLAFQSDSAQCQRISKEQYISSMKTGLDQVVSAIRRGDAKPTFGSASLAFSANFFFAHEVMIEHINPEALKKTIEAFRELGLTRIDINPGLFPWEDGKRKDVIAKYDLVIQAARAAGLQIVLNPQYSRTYHKISSLEDWSTTALPVYAELARRYKPDIFNVLHEPSTMAKRMGAKGDVATWVNFARQAAQIVKRESPSTRIAAGGLYTERDYIVKFLGIPELELISLNIYDLKGLKISNDIIVAAQARGKAVYIAETWRPPFFKPTLSGLFSLEAIVAQSVGDQDFEELDIYWLTTMLEYARAWKLESVTPFWTQTFFKYVEKGGNALDWKFNSAVVDAILKGKRSILFSRYREIIQLAR